MNKPLRPQDLSGQYPQFPNKVTDLVKTYKIIPDKRVDEMLSWFHEVEDRHIDGSVSQKTWNTDPDAPVEENDVNLKNKIAREVNPTPDDEIFTWISEIMNETYGRYLHECPGPVEDLVFQNYSVRVYHPNEGKFTYHFDQYAGGAVTRLFAVIMYLNDVEEGGETEFPNHRLACKCEKGKVLIFPCNYLFPHQGNMPVSNPKYICTGFINWSGDH
tara:strand:+ start:72 stop:719 length:648 start_codon:yes stop_codon:yes gene_type:complete